MGGYVSSVRLLPLALLLAAAGCGSAADRQDGRSAQAAPSATAVRGPDNLVLRIPRGGGTARVFAYPRLDTIVWSTASAPAPARILAFDDEAGTIAYVDAKGLPARIDFRQGAAFIVSKAKVTGVASSDGSTIYAIGAQGAVERYSRGGSWSWKPPLAARALFPQPDHSLLVLGERQDGSVVWRLRPPSSRIVDSVTLPRVDRTLRTQVGDRLYLSSGSDLTGIRTRTMERGANIALGDPIELLAATPSGDRVFAVAKGATQIKVVDRYQERVSGSIETNRNIADLRVDPLGRYLLAHAEGSDSVLVIALGTNRVIGTLASAWRSDLPFVAPDGGVAVAQGADVIIADGETLQPTVRVRGGAADFWFPFRWTGFRPRAAGLDRPVQFGGPDSGAKKDSNHTADSVIATVPGAVRDSAPAPRSPGFTVSFAALLAADKAHELAAQVSVGDAHARVVTAQRDGSTIYRVVMGPFPTRDEAERVGKESHQSFWVYEGAP